MPTLIKKGKRKLTKAKAPVADEPEVTTDALPDEPEPDSVAKVAPEPEGFEDGYAIAYDKETGESVHVTRDFSRTEEVLKDGTHTGETIVENWFIVDTGEEVVRLSESEFYRKYTPASHSDAKKLRQEPTRIEE